MVWREQGAHGHQFPDAKLFDNGYPWEAIVPGHLSQQLGPRTSRQLPDQMVVCQTGTMLTDLAETWSGQHILGIMHSGGCNTGLFADLATTPSTRCHRSGGIQGCARQHNRIA